MLILACICGGVMRGCVTENNEMWSSAMEKEKEVRVGVVEGGKDQSLRTYT
jgi:hypothetical protein